ncbi:hypothetical protein M9H77_06920 [Catharanthus roseus]|uniref:Uncharacterized protein n=1 Tax=Catharanthus roseus TaxID=4058 RepID=A0ACC0BTI2_CATRO|nr:hypothetical protein M9H77_06920 [Catharanthus roseus]
MSQSPIEMKNGPITRAQRRKPKILEDNGMVAYLEEVLKSKLEGFEGQEKVSKLFSIVEATKPSIEVLHEGGVLRKVLNQIYLQLRIHIKVVSKKPPNEVIERSFGFVFLFKIAYLIMSMDGHLLNQSHQEGTSDPTRMNRNEIFRSMQQSIEGLARQFQSVVRDVEELKKGKSSARMEQRVGDNLGGFNSPHHQRPFDIVSTYGYYDMQVQNSYPFHEGGRRGSVGGRGYHTLREEFPRLEAWYNIISHHGGYYSNQQGDNALDKIKWKVPSFNGASDPNVLLDWERQVENLFIVRSYSDIVKVKLVLVEFLGYALHWWERIVT